MNKYLTANVKAWLLTLVLTGFCVALLYGGYQYLQRHKYYELRQRVGSAHNALVLKIHNRISEMHEALYDLKLELIGSGHLTAENNTVDRKALIALFERKIDQESLISQVRWLDSQGYEQVRLDRKLLADGSWKVSVAKELQDKSDRYYFTGAINQPGNLINVSPVDLNIEHGKVVLPYEPTIRMAISTLQAENLRHGVLVINYNLSPLFKGLKTLASELIDVELVNPKGYWLFNSSKPELEWGGDLAQYEHNLMYLEPDKYSAMKSFENSQSKRKATGIRFSNLNIGGQPLTLITQIHPNEIDAETRADLIEFGGGVLVLYALGVVLIVKLYRSDKRQGEIKDQLKQQLEKVEQINHYKSQFLANMSHELRTPINGVVGITELLTDTGLTPEQLHFAKMIKQSSASLLDIINDILDYSKIESGMLQLEQIDFDLLELMRNIVQTFSVLVENKGLELVCPTVHSEQHYWFIGDPARLRQILVNLIGNALKFTEHGEVAVFYELLDKSEGRTKLKFTVSDTGIGIPEEKQQKLFQRFSQADSSTTRRFSGTGLGLAISKQLVEMMGGEIGVTSQEGEGSQFWFTVTLEDADVPDTAMKPELLRREKVLLVHNDLKALGLIQNILDLWRMKYAWESSMKAAITRMHQAKEQGEPFDIVLVGYSVHEDESVPETIKTYPELAASKFLLMTPQKHYAYVSREYASVYAGFVLKPVCPSVLYDAFIKLCDGYDPVSAVLEEPAEPLARWFQARVLVVEDNPTNQIVAKGLLQKFGLTVDLAVNGHEAVNALQKVNYDLVFMDCHMPVMDGYEATRIIRSEDGRVINPRVPIIALTANVLRRDRQLCYQSGMNDYVRKPIERTDIQKVLSQWLPEEKSGAGVAEPANKCLLSPEKEPGVVYDDRALLDRCMNDRELVKAVLDNFLDDMPKQIDRLKSCLDAGMTADVAAQAHKIKGAAANVGALALSEVAAELEKSGKSEDLQALQQSVFALDSRFEQFKTAIEVSFENIDS